MKRNTVELLVLTFGWLLPLAGHGQVQPTDRVIPFRDTAPVPCAQTPAAFPGVLGRLYRTVVIGSGGHRLVTRRLLRQVVRAT